MRLKFWSMFHLVKGLKDFEGTVERTLGVTWNVDEDSFYFQIEVQEKPMTKKRNHI